MDNIELMELAAKAAGYTLQSNWSHSSELVIDGDFWNPLSDDGDALRLAVKCGIEIWPDRKAKEIVVGFCVGKSQNMLGLNFTVDFEDDEMAATRLAIVRAAAQIGDDMIRAKEPAYTPLGQTSAYT